MRAAASGAQPTRWLLSATGESRAAPGLYARIALTFAAFALRHPRLMGALSIEDATCLAVDLTPHPAS